MKVLSINFLTCAVKACKSTSASFPLHPKDAELAQDEVELNPQFIANVLPRLDWAALKTTTTEVHKYTQLSLTYIYPHYPYPYVDRPSPLFISLLSIAVMSWENENRT